MQPITIKSQQLFCTEDAHLYPAEVECVADMRPFNAEIDVIVTAHNFPELTNVTLENYVLLQKDAHIVVVESSGDDKVFDKLLKHERVSRILLKTDVRIKSREHGFGSYGMALSAAVGAHLTRAPLLFFSHSDMIACQPNFLSYLRGKLTGGVRLASFTQRHMIPFSGSMLITRELIEEKGLDWLPMNGNPLLPRMPMKTLLPDNKLLGQIDCGEQYIFSEFAHGRPMYIAATRGGSLDWWKDLFAYFELPTEEIRAKTIAAEPRLQLGELRTDRERFAREHADVIKAGKDKWYYFEKPKWWRWSFDDEGRLIFIHYGRGTTFRAAKRWINYGLKFNARFGSAKDSA
jgi:hypothetical protein